MPQASLTEVNVEKLSNQCQSLIGIVNRYQVYPKSESVGLLNYQYFLRIDLSNILFVLIFGS